MKALSCFRELNLSAVTLRCEGEARASKGDGRRVAADSLNRLGRSSFEARAMRSHLRMTD
jgi:hypothetical protein